MMLAEPNWAQIVGYQHEVLHTGVLKYLLTDVVRGPSIASELAGGEGVDVGAVETEKRVRDLRGIADLTVQLRLVDGNDIYLAVETKVDSTATPQQLKATIRHPHRGVFLAMGITSLSVTSPPWNLDGWRVVRPADWAAIMLAHGATHDSVLCAYLREVERERDEHKNARALARDGMHGRWRLEHSRRDDGMLEHYAWLAEIRDELDRPHEWWTYTNRSGPIMQLGRPSFRTFDPATVTLLEIMCSASWRRLCLKVGSNQPGVYLAPAAVQARESLSNRGWQRTGHAASKAARYVTVAFLDLTKLGASEAAEYVASAIAELTTRDPD